MLKNLNLNVFGDSYSTPEFCVDSKDSFWGLMARDLAVKNICNYSHPGFSLDHIIHIILNESFDFENDYFCVCIPPLVRYAAYDDSSHRVWNFKKIVVDSFVGQDARVHSLDNVIVLNFRDIFDNHPTALEKFSAEWHDVQSLEKIFLLARYLKSVSAKFLILNLSNPIYYQDAWPAGKNIMKTVADMKECIIFNDTYYSVNLQDKIHPKDYDQYSWHGHHGENGNKNWYNKIIKNKMMEIGWIDA